MSAFDTLSLATITVAVIEENEQRCIQAKSDPRHFYWLASEIERRAGVDTSTALKSLGDAWTAWNNARMNAPCPVRAERARNMVPDVETWPQNPLPMKRIRDGAGTFGTINADENAGPFVIRSYNPDRKELARFDDIEALVADGWAVD